MPQAKLRQLVATLLLYRNELELQRRNASAAERSAAERRTRTAQALKGSRATLLTNAQRLVETQHLIIRDHCQFWGLPLPADVPTAVPTASEKDAR